MIKLNQTVYQKLLVQAEEAKLQGMDKLAAGILSTLTPSPEDEPDPIYSVRELNADIYQGMWKLAAHVLKYHDVNSVEADKLGDLMEIIAQKFINVVEQELQIEAGKIGKLEEKVLGQK